MLLDEDVKNSIRERNVSARLQLKMKIALSCCRCFTRIDDDPAAAVVALLPQKLVQHGKGFGAIRSRDQQYLGERYVAPRICGAVDAKSFIVPGGCGNHAEPAVVVDVTRAESGSRKLAHQIGLFSCQRRSRVNANRVLAVSILQFFELGSHEVERFIPRRAFEAPVSFDQRIQQAIRMVNLQVSRDALGTEASFVDRKIVTRLHADNMIPLD